MTASPTAPADPLAAAAPASAPASSPALAAAENSPAGAKTQKKSHGVLLIVALALGLLLVLGGGLTLLFMLPEGEPSAAAPSSPVPPDPGVPPPLPLFELAAATSESRADQATQSPAELLDALGKRPNARLFVGTGESVAPREFIVRGGAAGDAAGPDLPNHQRWELQFAPGITIEAYTRQLDHFQIELGVIGGSQQVTYLSNLSNPKPRARTAPGSADARLYMLWNRGPLREADEILVARAGLNAAGKVVAHFFPPQLETEMLRIEAAQAQVNKLTRVHRTAFTIQSAGPDSFRLVVAEQTGE